MKNYFLELKACCANQAGLPGAVASLSLNTLCAISAVLQKLVRVYGISTILIGNCGLLSLKIFNHTPSNSAENTNPIAIAAIICATNTKPLLNDTNGIKNQQLKNLIKRTFGKYLAYCNNCSGVISQYAGIEFGSGNIFQSLSLSRYKLRSIVTATIGNIIIKNPVKAFLPIKQVIKIAIRLVTITFNNIASSPDEAMILGLLKKAFNSINFLPSLVFQLKCIFYYKIAHNKLEQYVYISQLIERRSLYV